jgi:glycerate dehydrogenase
MPHIVILDGYTANPGDLSWEGLSAFGTLEVFDRTRPEDLLDRARGADIVLTNKVKLLAPDLLKLPQLRFISVTATGYNNVDVNAAKQQGIVVSNVRGYAAHAVAQHVFALILELTNRVGDHARHVWQGGWVASPDWSYTLSPIVGLAGKTIGIYGFGQIGQRVAVIAQAYGMRVVACHKHPERDARPGVRFLSFEEMLEVSDLITLHAPLTPDNQEIINEAALDKMKKTAFLINTGRGGLVNEKDLFWALTKGRIAGAGLDVLQEEPPAGLNMLLQAKNCIITPHIAWATVEARQNLIEESVENVRAFLRGAPRNVVF